jgi:hypothetical protein
MIRAIAGLFAATLVLFAIPARAQLPETSPTEAVEHVSVMMVYKIECLKGQELEPHELVAIAASLAAAGINISNPEIKAQVQTQMAKQGAIVRSMGGPTVYCPWATNLLRP